MTNKTFDCVEMKRRIQEQHLTLFEGKSAEEQRAMMRAGIESDPRLARFWRQARHFKSAAPAT